MATLPRAALINVLGMLVAGTCRRGDSYPFIRLAQVPDRAFGTRFKLAQGKLSGVSDPVRRIA